jgi:hypothetical protein
MHSARHFLMGIDMLATSLEDWPPVGRTLRHINRAQFQLAVQKRSRRHDLGFKLTPGNAPKADIAR